MLEFPEPIGIERKGELMIIQRNRSALKSCGQSKNVQFIHKADSFKLPEIRSPRYQESTNSDLSHLTSPRKYEKTPDLLIVSSVQRVHQEARQELEEEK